MALSSVTQTTNPLESRPACDAAWAALIWTSLRSSSFLLHKSLFSYVQLPHAFDTCLGFLPCFPSAFLYPCLGRCYLPRERVQRVSPAGYPSHRMLNWSREGLFELGRQLQQSGDSQAALHCFLSCLQGLTHVQSFNSLPNCLHQIAELYIDEKNYGKALQFIQAEKMFYEVALIELTSLQASTGNTELQHSQRTQKRRKIYEQAVHYLIKELLSSMESLFKSGSQDVDTSGSLGCLSQEELSEQASQAQDLERLAQLCIMSKRPHLALEYSGKATKIHQRAFGNNHPITARSLELLATVYAEIGKTEYSNSLGDCVSTLSKRFSAPESFSDALSSISHSHKDRHSEIRHRKEPYTVQDTLKSKVISEKLPISILKRSSVSSVETKRRSERRVRFREPEITVHVYDSPQSRLQLALLSCLFLMLSALALALYCTDRRRHHRTCEELQTALAVYLLQLKQIVWACWIWLTMQ
ncbi:hypothetical protein DNTS_027638 [Danionella cerebrum]|uniref:Consortin N-terminal domain-containing protein n=1 Tax=Danionella cerebrum TaxID=2873325 RepID=A0A553MXB7_9TELE|nr:hypothetical protein DNTS_027638 [Danionella translucida]